MRGWRDGKGGESLLTKLLRAVATDYVESSANYANGERKEGIRGAKNKRHIKSDNSNKRLLMGDNGGKEGQDWATDRENGRQADLEPECTTRARPPAPYWHKTHTTHTLPTHVPSNERFSSTTIILILL